MKKFRFRTIEWNGADGFQKEIQTVYATDLEAAVELMQSQYGMIQNFQLIAEDQKQSEIKDGTIN